MFGQPESWVLAVVFVVSCVYTVAYIVRRLGGY